MAFVKTEVQGAVEIITIDRPKALNALNPEVLADLKAAFEAVDQETVRCIVLTGEGDKSFVAGADIGSMSTMTKAEGEAFGKLGNDVFLMIESFPIPVIAAVNGFALGGGNELAMSCDIRICSDNAGSFGRRRSRPLLRAGDEDCHEEQGCRPNRKRCWRPCPRCEGRVGKHWRRFQSDGLRRSDRNLFGRYRFNE